MFTVTQSILDILSREGVPDIFGVPGRECNLDFIAAAEEAGVPFILTRTATAAVIMAAVSAELSDAIGCAMGHPRPRHRGSRQLACLCQPRPRAGGGDCRWI